jgi:hypothetical protein
MKFSLPILFAVSLITFGCVRFNQTPVPNIPFDRTIDLNLPSYSDLNGVGGYAYIDNVGSRGVIVYRRAIDEFIALDLHSPEDPEGDCFLPLFPLQDNFLILKDTCSGAQFSLYDGLPYSGSSYQLRQYRTTFNGSNLLRVFNL